MTMSSAAAGVAPSNPNQPPLGKTTPTGTGNPPNPLPPSLGPAGPLGPSGTPAGVGKESSSAALGGSAGGAGGVSGGSASSSAPKPASKQPTFAKVTGSKVKLIGLVVVALLVVAGIVFGLSRLFGGGGSTSVTTDPGTGAPAGQRDPAAPAAPSKVITYWGLWETSDVLEQVLADFETANPGVKVDYIKQTHLDYRERLQTAVASAQGPDLFRFHASWTPMLAQELAPLPSSVMSSAQYRETYFPIAAEQLQVGGQIVGIPLMYDGLGLYVNKEILSQAGVAVPTTWAELKTVATQLTIRSSNGEIERAGLAIGNAANVEHFSDILGLLMFQNKAHPSEPTTRQAVEALQFYTNFVTKDRVWSDKLPSSTVAFARGEVAMMFAPSWRVHEVIAINPEMTDFEVVPVPTLGDSRMTWASYWAEGVNSKSPNKDVAWELAKYLGSREVMEKMYAEQSQVRAFGQLYSRKDLAGELAVSSDPVVQKYVAPYLSEAENARSWYMNSYTHDKALNDQIITYYRDAVNAVLGGAEAAEAMTTVDQGIRQVLRQYGAAPAN